MPPSPSDDLEMMRAALDLAVKAKGTTFPNPAVGAVLVKNGAIVGRGATDRCGGPHAEKRAIAQAGVSARGATLYATLEPCCHFGRTPPCTDAIVAAGIARVVASVKDPNPLVSGKGLARLRRAGIAVSSGLLADQARRLNEDHFWSIVHGTPWISLKLAMTWDGRIADVRGASKWITSEHTRGFVHEVRRQHAGIAVGGATVRADDPELTVRLVRGASPVRFVFSSARSIPRNSRLAVTARATRTVRVVDGGCGPSACIDGSGAETWHTGSKTRLASMRSFMKMAHAEGITSILFEGGARMASFLMEHRLVNRLYLCYGNKIVGAGLDALTFARGLPIDACVSLDELQVSVLHDNVVVTGIPLWRH